MREFENACKCGNIGEDVVVAVVIVRRGTVPPSPSMVGSRGVCWGARSPANLLSYLLISCLLINKVCNMAFSPSCTLHY